MITVTLIPGPRRYSLCALDRAFERWGYSEVFVSQLGKPTLLTSSQPGARRA